MKYELYIDLFFLENLMMDYLILLLLRRILKNPAKDIRIFLGAIAGSLLTCMVLLLPVSMAVVKMILFHGFVSIAMLWIALEIHGIRQFAKAFFFLYISGVIFGGVLGMFSRYQRSVVCFAGLSILGYWISMGIWVFIENQRKISQTRCVVKLYNGDKSVRVRALIDTGNLLQDAQTGKSVSIIVPDLAAYLDLSKKLPEMLENKRFITYRSIGNRQGILPVFCIDKMCILYQGKRQEIQSPVLAVCKEELNSQEYQMILNPKVLEREEM